MKHHISHFSAGVLLTGAGLAGIAWGEPRDFASLQAHWNFDEGRDWHNMAYPFEQAVEVAKDRAGHNDITLKEGGLDAVKSWCSGHAYSGIRLGNGKFLSAQRPIRALNGDCTLSCWLRLSKGGGVIASSGRELTWGEVGADGKIKVLQGDKVLVSSQSRITDGDWHHIVITRSAASGAVALYVDGKIQGNAKSQPGKLKYNCAILGKERGRGPGLEGVIDEIHIFDKVVEADTIEVLRTNHTPKAFPQEYLISPGKPTKTGSILHLYTFDPERDKLQVIRYGAPEHGKVKYNKDGTFTYTSEEGFRGRDRFPVTVTDRKGGYSHTWIEVYTPDQLPKPLVKRFRYTSELALPGTDGKKTNNRMPMVADMNRDGKPDLIICGDSRLHVLINKSGKGKISFASPELLKDKSGKSPEARGAAMMQLNSATSLIVIRNNDGTLTTWKVVPGKDYRIEPFQMTIRDKDGNPFKANSNHIAFVDYNRDGRIDLLTGQSGGGIFLHLNSGSSKAPVWPVQGTNICGGTYNIGPSIGDLNNDGKPDLMHGINWGRLHAWNNFGGENILGTEPKLNLSLEGAPDGYLRAANGTFLATADLDGDRAPDLIIGGYGASKLCCALGIPAEAAKDNLSKIDEIYKGHEKDLGIHLCANDSALLKEYKALNAAWIEWAVGLRTVEERLEAYNMLKAHVRKHSFLKRQVLPAGFKKDKEGKITEMGPMHHVPGIFAQNWLTLHCLQPDSAEHRKDVADTLGMTGKDRECYLTTGVPLADNNKCSDGQLGSIQDLLTLHPRVMFPDDHLSIDRNMGDERDAMNYIFRSNKNTFGCDVGNPVCEMAGDLRKAAEAALGKGQANGDYFTFVMAHEVCHSMDNYIRTRANKELTRRWGDMIVYSANNGGESDLIAANDKGWPDMNATKQNFTKAGLWDGKSDWNAAWKKYWEGCKFRGLTFMRGNIDWFLGATQETLATQANHHHARTEARLIGAIDRFNRGYKANINEVVLYIDFLSGGLNKVAMYHTVALQKPNRVDYQTEYAWLTRNDKGHVTDIRIGDRHYGFRVDDTGRVIGITDHPWKKQLTPSPNAAK